jgi:5'-nucleotidase / UDP-sugar diphosphatase
MPYELQILHASDMEAGLPALTDAVNFSTVLNALKDDYANTLILTSGDNYIPGTFLSASSDPSLAAVLGAAGVGRADIALLNSMGFQASAFGNHEFDLGTSLVAGVIVPSGAYPGALFPYLSANLDFSGDSNLNSRVVVPGQDFSTITATNSGRISESAVLTVNGERIGIVGATTPTLPSISSPGPGVGVSPLSFAGTPTASQLDALAAIIQAEVDALTATGINKVVLLAHMQQISIEQALAVRLRNVDVIIAGGSNTLLADGTDPLRPGDAVDGVYPILTTSVTGEPVAIINTDGNYKYVGRLVAEFDDNGVLIPDSIDPNISGAYATDAANVAALTAVNPAAGGVTATPNPQVVAITDALTNVVISKDGNIFGDTDQFLNGTRDFVRSEETNLGNLTADANLAIAQQIDSTVVISLKNGGGIRDNIGTITVEPGAIDPNDVIKLPPAANPLSGKAEGEISQLDIENSLRFNNGLSLVTVTAAQLKELMEHGVAGVAPGRTPGAFPQVSGIAFGFDPTQPARTVVDGVVTVAGSRVQSLAITDAEGNFIDVIVEEGQIVGDPNRSFRMVTLNFLAGGGDSYPFTSFGEGLDRVDITQSGVRTGAATFADDASEQDAFAEYLAQIGEFNQADVTADQDLRIRNLSVALDGAGGEKTFGITEGDGDRIVTNFGGLNTATGDFEPEIDSLRFRGENLTLANLLLSQEGADLVISFANATDTSVTLKDFDLGDLGNGTNGNGNLIFDGQTTVEDRFQVFGATQQDGQVSQTNAITFLNDLDNDVQGRGQSNDVINGQGGSDRLVGLGGSDSLRGGDGNDTLIGGRGNDFLSGGEGDDLLFGGRGADTLEGGAGSDRFVISPRFKAETILDFEDGVDLLQLEGVKFNRLTITQGTGTAIDDTLISTTFGDRLLATLVGVQASTITSADFATSV